MVFISTLLSFSGSLTQGWSSWASHGSHWPVRRSPVVETGPRQRAVRRPRWVGDPTELVPEEWLELFRSIGRFALPRLIPGMPVKFNLFVEEVRGTGRLVWVCTRTKTVPTLRTVPRNGARRGYYKIQFETDEPEDFLDDWHERWGTCWPLVVDRGCVAVHPAFEGIYMRARGANGRWHAHVDLHRRVHWAMTAGV